MLNCSLYGIIRQAQEADAIRNILGARFGIEGILQGSFIDLGRQSEDTLERLRTSPGSAIGSSRRKILEDDYDRILDVLERHDVRYVLYNGGNGTMYGAMLLADAAEHRGYELGVIGVPKTVDNDLPATDRSPGYASAARYIAASVRELGTDVGSLPTPVSILETMGRNVGWLAAAAAAARTGSDTAPHMIYLPEKPFDKDGFLGELNDVLEQLGWAVVVVSEGLQDAEDNPVYVTDAVAQADAVGRILPGGVASYLADLAARELDVRCRSEKPGLCARSSVLLTSPVDRSDAECVGRMAVTAAVSGESRKMVALRPRRTSTEKPLTHLVPLQEAANGKKTLPEKFLCEGKSFVADDFLGYLMPLLGPDLPDFLKLF